MDYRQVLVIINTYFAIKASISLGKKQCMFHKQAGYILKTV
jgi:hypothetical protein